ncbi:MAG: hypothetical protein KF830_06470 [Planctomycetes bacterium]|nr:hypothetical protein [Planctomycetota bacterium]
MFLTTGRAAADELLGRVRARWSMADVVAFANDEDRDWLRARHPDVDLRRDKPPGGKVAFVRALRREAFAEVVVAWHGGERLQPLRLVALALGRRAVAIDERGRERRVAWWAPWSWGPHLLRRGVTADPLQVARLGAAAYRATIGLLLAVAWLPLRLWLLRGRRHRPGRAA